MKRDFTYIDDILDGVTRAIDRCAGYHVYNLGESSPVALSDLIRHIEHALGKKATLDRQPLQPGDVDQTYADLTAANRDLGYHPTTEIPTGLSRFVHWFRESTT
jgi:UDP-glucuronate 4-epimerase